MRIGNQIVTKDIFGRTVVTPAMEAEPGVPDLTRTTNNMMRKASGGRQDMGTAAEPATTSEETQEADGTNVDRDAMSGNTDNILGTPEGGSQDGPTDPLDDESQGDGLPPDEGEDDMGLGGDDMSGDLGEDTGDAWTKEQAASISKLHSRMLMLYRSAVTLKESLSEYSAPTSSPELRDVYASAVSHMSNMLEVLEDILSTSFTVDNYPEKLRKYVALRNLYNVVNEMLKLHFDALNVDNNQPS